MKRLVFIISTLLIAITLQAREPLPIITEEDAAALRAVMDIRELSSNRHFTEYAFRDTDRFLISTQTFLSQNEADAFCAGHKGYRLNSGMLPELLVMMGLPFVQLQKQMTISAPVLGDEGGRTGYAFWMRLDPATIPADLDDLQWPEDRLMIRRIQGGEDYLYAALNGFGGSGGGIHFTSEVNARLKQQGREPLAMAAICEAEALAAR